MALETNREDVNNEGALIVLQTKLKKSYRRMGSSLRTTRKRASEVGALLLEAKELMEEEEFGFWVGDNCEFTFGEAEDLMRVAEVFARAEAVRREFESTITDRALLRNK